MHAAKASPPRPQKKSRGTQTIFWWVVWITLTIASFFVAVALWTPLIARHFGSIHEHSNAVIWVIAVFGTWMVILLPLIVVMYQKVDKAYEDTRIRREEAASRFRSISMEKAKRLLPEALSRKMRDWPEAIHGGHLVSVILKDSRKIPNVFIVNRNEILGIYDFTEMPFETHDILDLEASDLSHAPAFLTTKWLRLDGVTAP